MKKTHFVTSALLALSMVSLAHAAIPKDEGDLIAAQVGVTRDGIAQVLKGMDRISANARLDTASHPDFLAKAKALNVDVDAAMTAYETGLREKVLRPAQLWVDRLRNISGSKIYTEDQRRALFDTEYRLASKSMETLAVEYARLIWDLYYAAIPRAEVQFVDYDAEKEGCNANNNTLSISWSRCLKKLTIKTRVFSRDARIGLEQIAEQTLSWSGWDLSYDARKDMNEERARAMINPNLYQSYRDETVKTALFNRYVNRGCYSTACGALFSGQLASYLKLVRQTLDREIRFETGSYSNALVIPSPGVNVDSVAEFFAMPRDLAPLPFDISEADYRSTVVNSVATLLINRDLDLKAGCPNAVARPLQLLCHSDAGCLNESERSIIASRIEGADVRNKPARAACLVQTK